MVGQALRPIPSLFSPIPVGYCYVPRPWCSGPVMNTLWNLPFDNWHLTKQCLVLQSFLVSFSRQSSRLGWDTCMPRSSSNNACLITGKHSARVNHDAEHPGVPEESPRQQQQHHHLVDHLRETAHLFLRLPLACDSRLGVKIWRRVRLALQ